MHLARGSGAIALGFLLFALRLCGGGDVKLFAAVSLWAGPSLFIPFAYYTALAGGLMALVLWLNHKVKRAGIPANLLFVRSDAAFAKQPMHYGVAIAAGGLFVALQLLLKDRKSVVKGKSVEVRVDFVGRRLNKNKKQNHILHKTHAKQT